VARGIHVDQVRLATGVNAPRHGEGRPLVYAGRLLLEKRVDLLLRVVALLKDGHSGVFLTVFCVGSLREALVCLAAEPACRSSTALQRAPPPS